MRNGLDSNTVFSGLIIIPSPCYSIYIQNPVVYSSPGRQVKSIDATIPDSNLSDGFMNIYVQA